MALVEPSAVLVSSFHEFLRMFESMTIEGSFRGSIGAS